MALKVEHKPPQPKGTAKVPKAKGKVSTPAKVKPSKPPVEVPVEPVAAVAELPVVEKKPLTLDEVCNYLKRK